VQYLNIGRFGLFQVALLESINNLNNKEYLDLMVNALDSKRPPDTLRKIFNAYTVKRKKWIVKNESAAGSGDGVTESGGTPISSSPPPASSASVAAWKVFIFIYIFHLIIRTEFCIKVQKTKECQ
jgi:hypothetical protein